MIASDARPLQRVLIVNFLVHGLAMVAMLLFLIRALPGGLEPDDGARIARIAAHPWQWRLGWFPWQLTAAADVWLGVALLRAPFIPRRPAIYALVLTGMAILPDQGAQLMLVTRGVTLAQAAVLARDPTAYLAFERWWFPLTAAWAACLYTAAAIAWSVCFARARVWSSGLRTLSIATFTVFGTVSVGVLLPPPLRLPQEVLSAGNAIGFTLFELWLLAVILRVRARKEAP